MSLLERMIDFSHEKDLTVEELIQRIKNYHKEVDEPLITKAYEFAAHAHRHQKRSSGEPYIIHPLNVSATLAKLKMDEETIVAGLLHDVVEDCDITPEEIEREFSNSIAQIVVGLTKISKIEFKSQLESQAENFRKMVVAMAKDLRVIIVKLADRMHNMRTLQYVSIAKQKKIAQETLDIYVPLASRLGINSLKGELEDLCLRYLHPDSYYRLAEKVAMKKDDRENYIANTVSLIKEKLDEYMVESQVSGRPKNFYSIYKKMKKREVDFEQIQDLLAFRIIVTSITDCYKSLGIIHSYFTPVPGRFKDYIAIPKVNNYQSLHSTVMGPKGERIEIQIRTWEMHEVAEKGIAAHWKYKEHGSTLAGQKRLDWINELVEFNQALDSNTEFMDVVKNDLDMGGVFIFTPTGDVKELRFGATPLDFAYAVHTEVGNRCVGAKVNGKIVPLKYRLKSGDSVEILTSKNQTPTRDWLKIVKTSRARTKIRQHLSKLERDAGIDIGRQMLENALRVHQKNIKTLEKCGDLKIALDYLNLKELDELFFQLSAGNLNTKSVLSCIPSLKDSLKEKTLEGENFELYSDKIKNQAKGIASRDNAVIVEGIDDVEVRLGRCCNPIPGDNIFGFITKGRGITIHNANCNRIAELDQSRRVFVEWNPAYQQKHSVSIKVITHDKPGILSHLSKQINNMGINIKSALARSMPDAKGNFIFEVEVKDYSDLMRLVSMVESNEEVIAVSRT